VEYFFEGGDFFWPNFSSHNGDVANSLVQRSNRGGRAEEDVLESSFGVIVAEIFLPGGHKTFDVIILGISVPPDSDYAGGSVLRLVLRQALDSLGERLQAAEQHNGGQ